MRIVRRSLTRHRRPKLLSLLAVALGTAVVTVVGTMALDVGDKVNRELRSFGANILVTPAADGLAVAVGGVDYRPAGTGAFLAEADLPKLKKIFWRNNILAFAPFLYVPATVQGRRVVLIGTWFERSFVVDQSEVFRTGLRDLHPTWKIQGEWPKQDDAAACLVGRRLGRALGLAPGRTLNVHVAPPAKGETGKLKMETDREFRISNFEFPVSSFEFRVRGILETGGPEDDQILVPLEVAQRLAGEEGKVRRVEVSALTKPDDDFARSDPGRMTPEEFERWSCSPYVRSIAYQIQQAIPGAEAKPVFPVAETGGKILNRIRSLMAVLAGAALAAAALAVASMMLATILERGAEFGLFKSLGATSARVAAVLLLEASVIGLLGGVAGYLGGSLLARRLASAVFGSPVGIHWALLPAAVTLALLVVWAGSVVPLARGLKVPASVALRD